MIIISRDLNDYILMWLTIRIGNLTRMIIWNCNKNFPIYSSLTEILLWSPITPNKIGVIFLYLFKDFPLFLWSPVWQYLSVLLFHVFSEGCQHSYQVLLKEFLFFFTQIFVPFKHFFYLLFGEVSIVRSNKK